MTINLQVDIVDRRNEILYFIYVSCSLSTISIIFVNINNFSNNKMNFNGSFLYYNF